MPPSPSALLDDVLLGVCALYLLTVAAHLTCQILFAERARRRRPAPDPGHRPGVDVVVPCHNEDPDVLAACLASIAAQDYAGDVQVHVVDDGSPNRATLDPVYARFTALPGFRLIAFPDNRGKRQAQAAAVTDSAADIVITVDSDTVIAPDGVRRLVATFADPLVGAAMGEMLAANAGQNLLTRLIDLRYWYACNQERAAQSHFSAVLCCCGPFSGYRRSVLEKVLDDYLHHTFRGRPSNHGEDRHLTNLMLRSGMRTVYAPDARSATVVPDRLRPFLRQQLRWSRSVYRDTLWMARKLPSLGAYAVLDTFAQVAGPVLLGAALALAAVRAATAGPGGWPWFAAGALGVAAAYCGYGTWRLRHPRFLAFALYGVLHCALLIPVRLRALLSLGDDSWGRRGAAS
ncbi:glycosyltransferase family 2 protein [Streptomyces sp. V4-01]|uniref:Hyaluronan synthase n=1 Tax=Actinacidiphila polyblastidii TaxID=3110430 RepID=A0ABU7PID9_9ACTN|nr:glycosyltransferase family 2 protein [Streptomyces sp. V4-01]